MSERTHHVSRGRATVLLAVVAIAAFAGGGRAEGATTAPTFARSDLAQLGNNHLIADLNGDGRNDLAGIGAQTAAVYLSTGPGTFGARAEYPVANWGQDVAAGDFNGDGRVDLAVTVADPQTSVSLLMGRGDGTFAPATHLANSTGFDSPAIAAADLNNDGRLDLAVAHSIACFTAPCRVTTLMSIHVGRGDGTFEPARDIDVGRGMSRIAVADFNRDGAKDLAVAGDSSRLYRMYGAGDGTFVQQPTITMTADTLGVDATDVDVADFNGDGIHDLAVAIALNGSRTAILAGNADGTFGQPLILTDPFLSVPQYVAVGDYNGDGFQDIAMAMANGNSGLMQLRNGNGDGTFQSPLMYFKPPNQSSIGGIAIVSGNLNGDSKTDVALGIGGASSGLAVLLNTTGSAPPPPPATPAAPSLVSPAQDGTPAQPVLLDWSDVANAASYRIQVDDASTFSSPFVLDRTVTASQLTAPTLAARRHWWRVRAINSAGTAGPWSSVRRFIPASSTPVAAALSAVSVSPSSVTGGELAQGTVTLTAPAPAGGFVVSLSNTTTAASVPASVTVAQGATGATFTVSTSPVATATAVTITAAAGGVTRTTTLTVAPPGQAATLTVTATGRGGERVTSTPAGIDVAVGSSGSASFTTGTSITLRSTNSRDVVWSGACSSGGSRAKTCTFTLRGDASVTAAVQ